MAVRVFGEEAMRPLRWYEYEDNLGRHTIWRELLFFAAYAALAAWVFGSAIGRMMGGGE